MANLEKKIQKHLDSFDNDFEPSCTTFQCKGGKDLKSGLSKTKDVKNQFLYGDAELRGFRKPKVILGVDGDVMWCDVMWSLQSSKKVMNMTMPYLQKWRPEGHLKQTSAGPRQSRRCPRDTS